MLGVDPGIRTGLQARGRERVGRLPGQPRHPPRIGPRARVGEGGRCASPSSSANVSAVAVGNGTAGRETEAFVRGALGELGLGRVPVVMVSEAGASVYSASEVAREEFPELDLTIRGAISIARRLQDPLAELVKVDPKSIGVGPVPARRHAGAAQEEPRDRREELRQLGRRQREHRVAVPAGRGRGHRLVARRARIAEHRQKKGVFKEKRDLLEVSRFSDKVFEQAAGFLRIPGAAHPLDNTGIHPERYPVLEKLAARLGKSVGELVGAGRGAREEGRAVPRRGRRSSRSTTS